MQHSGTAPLFITALTLSLDVWQLTSKNSQQVQYLSVKLLDDNAYPPLALLLNLKTLILLNYHHGKGPFLLSDHAHMRG